jgi:hypothetical protein
MIFNGIKKASYLVNDKKNLKDIFEEIRKISTILVP